MGRGLWATLQFRPLGFMGPFEHSCDSPGLAVCPGPSCGPSVCLRRCSGVGEATPLL